MEKLTKEQQIERLVQLGVITDDDCRNYNISNRPWNNFQ